MTKCAVEGRCPAEALIEVPGEIAFPSREFGFSDSTGRPGESLSFQSSVEWTLRTWFQILGRYRDSLVLADAALVADSSDVEDACS